MTLPGGCAGDLRLLEFKHAVEYKKGVHNCQADTVSRLPSAGHIDAHVDYELPFFMTAWSVDDTSDANYLFAVTEERPQPVNSVPTEELR